MKLSSLLLLFPVCITCSLALQAQTAFVRVNQIGYELNGGSYRGYLMTTSPAPGASFDIVDAKGQIVYNAAAGSLLGLWSHSESFAYEVYPLDFRVPAAGIYSIAVSGPVTATSPEFAVDSPQKLYSGLLLNTKFFYETERDGPDYVPNALRSAPGHVNDLHAAVYLTPPLDSNDSLTTTGQPLTATGTILDASGGWWDAGDYMKYVETISYTVALQQIGIRDFPSAMGPGAPIHPPAPPAAISYSGAASGAPVNSDFTDEAKFGLSFLSKMWDNSSRTLYYQVGNSQDWNNFPGLLSDYDIWRLPQADDDWDNCAASASFICYRPVFLAGAPGSKISPNLAGRLAADFALCYQVFADSDSSLANQCLVSGENIFALADTSLSDPAQSVDSGSCPSGCLLTIIPFDGYPETVWDDDMELGATELYFALALAQQREALQGAVPAGLRETNPKAYLAMATQFGENYITRIYQKGEADTLNLYDVSGLAHYELYRALISAGNPAGLALTATDLKNQLLLQVGDAIAQAQSDAWGFGAPWTGDTTSHGAGVSVMASEALALTGESEYNVYSQRWMANILGANAWGSSFIVGDGSKAFPNCIQHQVANLAGNLDGTAGGTPVLWGAATEGPAGGATSGLVPGLVLCSAEEIGPYTVFDGNDGAYGAWQPSIYLDAVQSYSTTEPAIDLTSTSFLMWAWRLALAGEFGRD